MSQVRTYVRLLCKSCWQGTKEFTKAHWFIELAISVVGGIVAGMMAQNSSAIIIGVLTGILTFIGVLALRLVYDAFASPYRVWDELQSRIEKYEPRAVIHAAGNIQSIFAEPDTYLIQVSNHGADSENCLARLVRYKECGNWIDFNKALVTVRQYEEQRSGGFNLRQGESKYLPLIVKFPDGYRFITETVPSSAVDLSSPCIAEIALYGCGAKVSASIGIENDADGRLRFWLES